MLQRLIYASEAVGMTGASTLSVAQILGVSERNNRRDRITSCLMFHQGHVLQVLEGGRVDLDRLMRRLLADPRHRDVRVLIDTPTPARAIPDPMILCADPAGMLRHFNLASLAQVSAQDAQAMLDFRQAA